VFTRLGIRLGLGLWLVFLHLNTCDMNQPITSCACRHAIFSGYRAGYRHHRQNFFYICNNNVATGSFQVTFFVLKLMNLLFPRTIRDWNSLDILARLKLVPQSLVHVSGQCLLLGGYRSTKVTSFCLIKSHFFSVISHTYNC